jgi:hypothetical protein
MLEAFVPAAEASKRRRIKRELAPMEYVSTYRELLIQFSSVCAFCLIHGDQKPHHTIVKCPTILKVERGKALSEYKAWKSKIRYKTSVCWKCHVPQGEHDSLHPQFVKGSNGCEFDDIIAPFAFAIFCDSRRQQICNDRFAGSMTSLEEFIKWSGGATVQGHLSNLSALFFSFAGEVWED